MSTLQKKLKDLTPLIKLPESFQLTIEEKVLNQIKHYCANVPNLEWSGNVWFTVEKNKKGLKIVCKDMLLMNILNPGYTEFENNSDVSEYVMKNLKLMDYRMGLIHSHNTMATFFSSEDNDELRRNTKIGDDSYYFSLIVNNKLDLTARLTKRIKNEISKDVYLGSIQNESIYYFEFNGHIENPYALSEYQLNRFSDLYAENVQRKQAETKLITEQATIWDESSIPISTKEKLAYCIALDERATTIKEAIDWQLDFMETPDDLLELKQAYLENLVFYIDQYGLKEKDINLINEYNFIYPEFVKLFSNIWQVVWKTIKQDLKMQNGSTLKNQ